MRSLVLVALLAACGDDGDEVLAQLEALPNARVAEWTPPDGFERQAGYRYFDLWFTQPVDHGDPAAGSFEQYAALMHRDAEAPLVLHTSGYDAGWTRHRNEATTLLDANQLSLEYRYYADSRPDTVDWSTLTVRQNAADEHAVLETIGAIYSGPKFQSGGSKGGETAMFHMMLYPDDLAGAITYVAPVITDLPDTRYTTVLDDIGAGEPAIDACRASLRAVQRELLVRRSAIEALTAAEEPEYTIAGVDHAVETAIVELEFVFWMTRGEDDCTQIPATTASDDALYTFLVDTNSPVAFSDAALHSYGQQYLFQDMLELGYPVLAHGHLDDLTRYSYEDWTVYLPTALPVYDPTIARELDAYLRGNPRNILHVGGQWDPWGAGYPTIAGDSSLDFSVPRGSHWSSGIYSLPAADKALAVDTLRRWAGLDASSLRRPVTVPEPLAPMASRGPRAAWR